MATERLAQPVARTWQDTMNDALIALHHIAHKASVRPAGHLDVPAIVELGRAFFAVSDMEALAAFDSGSFATSLHGMIENDDAILLVAEIGGEVVGMAGAMVFKAYWNSAIKVGQETFWWVQPEHRGEAGPVLLHTLEGEAAERGARTFLMVSLEALRPDAVGKLYERRGYAPLERSYWKAL